MKKQQFGKGGPNVSVIGQGTWYLDRGDRKKRDCRTPPWHRARHDPYRHRRDVRRCRARHRGSHRRPARRCVPGVEGAAEQRLAPRHHHRLRAIAEAAEDRPARLLSPALARFLSACRRRLRPSRNSKRAGKIRSWGVSNFDADDLDEILEVSGDGKIACNQVLYHLKERAIEHAVIPWCAKHGVAVVAYSPFGHNDFPQARAPAARCCTRSRMRTRRRRARSR